MLFYKCGEFSMKEGFPVRGELSVRVHKKPRSPYPLKPILELKLRYTIVAMSTGVYCQFWLSRPKPYF